MSNPPPRMAAEHFERIALECRWTDAALGAVRAVLVDGSPLPQAAAAFDIEAKKARIYLSRFIEKSQKVRVGEFMQREAPKLGGMAALQPFATEARTLHGKGYTAQQIVEFYRQNGVKTSTTTVRKFLRSIP